MKDQETVNDTSMGYTYTRIEFHNGVVVGINQNNNIIMLSNYRDDYTGETQVNTQEDIEPIISKITADFNFVEDYSLNESKALDEDYWELYWQKGYQEVYNSYEALRVLVGRKDQSIVFLKKFDIRPADDTGRNNEDAALATARETFSLHQSSKTIENHLCRTCLSGAEL